MSDSEKLVSAEIDRYKKKIEKNKSSIADYYNIGALYLYIDNFDEAKIIFNSIIDMQTNAKLAYSLLADTLCSLLWRDKEFNEVFRLCEKLKSFGKPYSSVGYRYYNWAIYEKDNITLSEQRTNLEMAYEVSPNWPIYASLLAYLFALEKNYKHVLNYKRAQLQNVIEIESRDLLFVKPIKYLFEATITGRWVMKDSINDLKREIANLERMIKAG